MRKDTSSVIGHSKRAQVEKVFKVEKPEVTEADKARMASLKKDEEISRIRHAREAYKKSVRAKAIAEEAEEELA